MVEGRAAQEIRGPGEAGDIAVQVSRVIYHSTTKSMDVICHTDEIICCSILHSLVYKMVLMLTVLTIL